ncbi:MAG: hypothetical protein RL077_961, partial [Verrucomicrobiota bacterium]
SASSALASAAISKAGRSVPSCTAAGCRPINASACDQQAGFLAATGAALDHGLFQPASVDVFFSPKGGATEACVDAIAAAFRIGSAAHVAVARLRRALMQSPPPRRRSTYRPTVLLLRQSPPLLPAGISLISRFAKPLHGLGGIFRYAFAIVVHPAEAELRVGIALLSLFPRLAQRLCKSDRHQKSGHAKEASKASHGQTVRAMATESKEMGRVGGRKKATGPERGHCPAFRAGEKTHSDRGYSG